MWPDALAVNQAKLDWRSGGRSRRRSPATDNPSAEGTEARSDFDPEVEAFKSGIAVLRPDLNADGVACRIDDFIALRDREEFRHDKMQKSAGQK